jgi:hypothetical protein
MLEKPLHPRQQNDAKIGDIAAGAPAFEQRRVHPFFQCVDRLRHAGLR